MFFDHLQLRQPSFPFLSENSSQTINKTRKCVFSLEKEENFLLLYEETIFYVFYFFGFSFGK